MSDTFQRKWKSKIQMQLFCEFLCFVMNTWKNSKPCQQNEEKKGKKRPPSYKTTALLLCHQASIPSTHLYGIKRQSPLSIFELNQGTGSRPEITALQEGTKLAIWFGPKTSQVQDHCSSYHCTANFLKPHSTTYNYLHPLYSKPCLIGARWSPITPFFLC